MSQEAQIIDGYADQQVSLLLSKGTPEEQAWAWSLLSYFRRHYPKADHWTVNVTPPDIRIGVRSVNSDRGKVAFYLHWYGGEICCSLNGTAGYRRRMADRGLSWEIRLSSHPNFIDIENWFDSLEKVFQRDQLPIDGGGLMPASYSVIEATETRMEIKEASVIRLKPELNQILFGPPGTGKTYATIDTALEILDPEHLELCRENRAALKERFDELAAAGQVRFVTFHQSFSYEDFVEGLRAVTDEESGQIRYKVVDGVFKSLCVPTPVQSSLHDSSYADTSLRERRFLHIRFGSAGQHMDEIEKAIKNRVIEITQNDVTCGDIVIIVDGKQYLKAIGFVTAITEQEEGLQTGLLEINVEWRAVFDKPVPISNLLSCCSSVSREYFVRKDKVNMEFLGRILHSPEIFMSKKREVEDFSCPPTVLIIDEINRGNVSRIFGELITLIEPSKRAEADEALSVVLPYSKEHFSVPGNVYLIGTMNTADRSLAGLDIALRRRFTFREMPPKPELLDRLMVEGVDVGEMLRVMNQRIEVLLDRDHCLGHAYFMPLLQDPSLARLESIFRNQVLPLLQEYFFEDWQRIQWVLNDHRKAALDRFVYQRRSDVQSLFGTGVEVSAHNLPWSINEEAFERPEAYRGIIDHLLAEAARLVVREAEHGTYRIKQLSNGTIEVWRDGVCEPVARSVLCEIAEFFGISLLSSEGNQLNTQALGRKVLQALETQQA